MNWSGNWVRGEECDRTCLVCSQVLNNIQDIGRGQSDRHSEVATLLIVPDNNKALASIFARFPDKEIIKVYSSQTAPSCNPIS